tara:strand:- start:8024 stop:8449 length:426 start_codon:yes stop_codon:yes gene_type:complete
MKDPKIISGGIHSDERGSISFVNGFDFSEVKRFYNICHSTTEIIRAWQGHKEESKWFYVSSGSFKIVLVKIDDWALGIKANLPLEFHLDFSEPQILFIPGGYVNGFQATSPDSQLMVFSNFTMEESKNDDFRFEKDLWYKW